MRGSIKKKKWCTSIVARVAPPLPAIPRQFGPTWQPPLLALSPAYSIQLTTSPVSTLCYSKRQERSPLSLSSFLSLFAASVRPDTKAATPQPLGGEKAARSGSVTGGDGPMRRKGRKDVNGRRDFSPSVSATRDCPAYHERGPYYSFMVFYSEV